MTQLFVNDKQFIPINMEAVLEIYNKKRNNIPISQGDEALLDAIKTISMFLSTEQYVIRKNNAITRKYEIRPGDTINSIIKNVDGIREEQIKDIAFMDKEKIAFQLTEHLVDSNRPRKTLEDIIKSTRGNEEFKELSLEEIIKEKYQLTVQDFEEHFIIPNNQGKKIVSVENGKKYLAEGAIVVVPVPVKLTSPIKRLNLMRLNLVDENIYKTLYHKVNPNEGEYQIATSLTGQKQTIELPPLVAKEKDLKKNPRPQTDVDRIFSAENVFTDCIEELFNKIIFVTEIINNGQNFSMQPYLGSNKRVIYNQLEKYLYSNPNPHTFNANDMTDIIYLIDKIRDTFAHNPTSTSQYGFLQDANGNIDYSQICIYQNNQSETKLCCIINVEKLKEFNSSVISTLQNILEHSTDIGNIILAQNINRLSKPEFENDFFYTYITTFLHENNSNNIDFIFSSYLFEGEAAAQLKINFHSTGDMEKLNRQAKIFVDFLRELEKEIKVEPNLDDAIPSIMNIFIGRNGNPTITKSGEITREILKTIRNSRDHLPIDIQTDDNLFRMCNNILNANCIDKKETFEIVGTHLAIERMCDAINEKSIILPEIKPFEDAAFMSPEIATSDDKRTYIEICKELGIIAQEIQNQNINEPVNIDTKEVIKYICNTYYANNGELTESQIYILKYITSSWVKHICFLLNCYKNLEFQNVSDEMKKYLSTKPNEYEQIEIHPGEFEQNIKAKIENIMKRLIRFQNSLDSIQVRSSAYSILL